eukprot:GFYU01017389.1.p1 GENE.GFYU01017389.1~~GFYU01017389.1.p1  ORF type:complete len:230 (+),score=35.13 GFYU01017389.1:55-744(+)
MDRPPVTTSLLQHARTAGFPTSARLHSSPTGASLKMKVGMKVMQWTIAYTQAAYQNPVRTEALSSAVVSAVGDLTCQLLVERRPFDLTRFRNMTMIGGFVLGPVLYYWFTFLNMLVTAKGTSGALQRMLWDQVVFAPPFITLIVSGLQFLETQEVPVFDATLKKEIMKILKANWLFWIPVTFINFRYVPRPLQLLFGKMMGLIWNIYISAAANRKLKKPDDDADGAKNK